MALFCSFGWLIRICDNLACLQLTDDAQVHEHRFVAGWAMIPYGLRQTFLALWLFSKFASGLEVWLSHTFFTGLCMFSRQRFYLSRIAVIFGNICISFQGRLHGPHACLTILPLTGILSFLINQRYCLNVLQVILWQAVFGDNGLGCGSARVAAYDILSPDNALHVHDMFPQPLVCFWLYARQT